MARLITAREITAVALPFPSPRLADGGPRGNLAAPNLTETLNQHMANVEWYTLRKRVCLLSRQQLKKLLQGQLVGTPWKYWTFIQMYLSLPIVDE
jgi:hypothetical protein